MKKKSKSSQVAVMITTVIMFVGIAVGADALFDVCFSEQKKEKAEKARKELNELINQYCMKYEHKTFFADKKYDKNFKKN